jgi:hypothetical protein
LAAPAKANFKKAGIAELPAFFSSRLESSEACTCLLPGWQPDFSIAANLSKGNRAFGERTQRRLLQAEISFADGIAVTEMLPTRKTLLSKRYRHSVFANFRAFERSNYLEA